MSVFRIYVEKKPEFAVEAKNLLADVKTALRLDKLRNIRILNRYDAEGLSEADFKLAIGNVFSEPAVDTTSAKLPELGENESVFAVEYLPGQFDQRADSCEQCIQILTQGERCKIKNARIYIVDGKLSASEMSALKAYIINPVESREASLDEVSTLVTEYDIPTEVATLETLSISVKQNLLTLFQSTDLQWILTILNSVRNISRKPKSVTQLSQKSV